MLTGVSSLSANNSAASSSDNAAGILGKDDFLLLLVTQMRNQDPLSPMESTEYVSQLAQFSSLEEMKNISKSIDDLTASQSASSATDAVGFIGREITAVDGQSGTVTSVTYEGGATYLMIGSVRVPLGDVTEVR
jgi:flagellar basal-body rod modification protein FlgD